MITLETLKSFRGDFADAVRTLEDKYGIKIELGNIRFTNAQFSAKMSATSEDQDALRLQFERQATVHGFPSGLFNKEFEYGGETFMFVGFKSGSSKYTCKTINLRTGKAVLFTENCLKMIFKK